MINLRAGLRTMGFIRQDLISMREIIMVFAACVLPIYIWSILSVLREIPAWIMYMSAWDLIGVIANSQAFALIESLVI